MTCRRLLSSCSFLSLTGLLLLSSQVQAIDADKVKSLLQQAQQLENQAEWDKACDLYEAATRLDRTLTGLKERYQNCLRRYWQARRHRDLSYRKEVLALDYGQALKLYGIIRDTLLDSSLEKKKADPGALFRKGLEELDHALNDPLFRQAFLPAVGPEELAEFRKVVRKNWSKVDGMSRGQLAKNLRDVVLTAQTMLGLDATVAIMEFACGACYALDEYTLYLTPNQLRELADSLRGEFASVGLAFRVQDGKLVIGEVTPFSPAAEIAPPLAMDDQVLTIDGKMTAQLSPESALALLHGPVGSTVEVTVLTPGVGMRMVQLKRRTTFAPSVGYQIKNDFIGYMQVTCFQDTTVQELEDALNRLTKNNVRGLILDLRGNSGGLFDSSIEAAKRFLATGVIASKGKIVYQANNPGASNLPLVVLIDGDTASAAEVLAGALKENRRARLVGVNTFGKGCTQCLVELPSAPGGIPTGGLRLTVDRFFGPDGQPYTGRGVAPHLLVERLGPNSSMMNLMDQQLEAALLEVQRLLDGHMR